MPLLLLVDVAVDRGRALADPARVEAHDVEALVERAPVARRPDLLEVVHRRPARAAEVEEERADPVRLVRRRHARDRDVHLAPAGVVVVERQVSRGALGGRGLRGRAAGRELAAPRLALTHGRPRPARQRARRPARTRARADTDEGRANVTLRLLRRAGAPGGALDRRQPTWTSPATQSRRFQLALLRRSGVGWR